MEYSDKLAWDEAIRINGAEESGRATITFAHRWANAMEAAMRAGEPLEACAKRTSVAANVDGISDYMYGLAVELLVQCWVHGEQLRLWHNLDVQMQDEGEEANRTGGLLNPASFRLRRS